jgi:transglutaminase-like putative cysteine protease
MLAITVANRGESGHTRPVELTPASNNLDAYLESSEVIDWSHPAVSALASELGAGRGTAAAKAQAVYEWMQREVPHSVDTGRQEVTCAASEVLSLRTGICYGQSHLLAALLRSVGVPTGFSYQITDDIGGLHGFGAALIDGTWVPLDSRGPAPFSALGVLAWPMDPLMDGIVYAEPLPNVVAGLRKHGTVAELCADLPNVAEVGSQA